MNNYKKNQFIFLITYFLALTVFVVTPCGGKKSHDNHVSFESDNISIKGGGSKKVQCVTFLLTDYCITSKQPFYAQVGKFLPHQNNSMTLTVKAGRKHSSGPAQCFNNWVDENNVFGKYANALNFAVKGTMKLYSSGDCNDGSLLVELKDMALGQGHSGATNNWWMGGAKCGALVESVISGPRRIRCTTKTDGRWDFFRPTGKPTVIKISGQNFN